MAKAKYPMSPRALAAEGAGVSFQEMTWDNPAIGQVYSFLYRNFPETAPRKTGEKQWKVSKEQRDAFMEWAKSRTEAVAA